MKWLLAVITGLLISLLVALPADSAMVTVIWKPLYGIQPPSSLTAEYTDDYTINLTWSMGQDSTQTMIRARYDQYPEDTEDGRLVYLGDDEEFSDDNIGISLGEPVYYRAWGEDAGEYSIDYDEATTEGETVFTVGLILLTSLIVGLAFWRGDYYLYIVGSIAAIGFGAYWISSNSGFAYVIVGMVAVAIGLYMIYSTAISLMRR